MNSKRKEAEDLIYRVMDTLDNTKRNSTYYKEKFANMSDAEFIKFNTPDRVYALQVAPFEIEPTMSDIKKAADIIEVPLIEPINLPYIYKNASGKAVQSQPCYTIYAHIKRMKQLLTKKIHTGTDSSKRDINGRLIGDSKGGQTTDREFEAMVVLGLDSSVEEFSRSRADSVYAGSVMANIISSVGQVSINDLPKSKDDSVSNKITDSYLIGAQLKSNLITDDDYLISTIKDKRKGLTHET